MCIVTTGSGSLSKEKGDVVGRSQPQSCLKDDVRRIMERGRRGGGARRVIEG